MAVTSKILQLVEIFRVKDTSAISSTTWFLSAFTNASKWKYWDVWKHWETYEIKKTILARIYTIFLDSADVLLLLNFIISTVLSTAVYIAVLYYKKPESVLQNDDSLVQLIEIDESDESPENWIFFNYK